MGNIRPTYIKRIAAELLTRFPEHFGKDFEANKRKVSELTDIKSRIMRNRVAGYVTRKKARMEAL